MITLAVRAEGAVQLADILHRRTMVGLSPALGLDVDREVAAVAAPLLGWADADVHEQVRRHRGPFLERAETEGFEVMISSPLYCTDNGAMIASLASFYAEKGAYSTLDIKAYSRMIMK